MNALFLNPPNPEPEGRVWFRKRLEMLSVARGAGVADEFKALAAYVHQDDMYHVQEFLGVTDECMAMLFAEDSLSFNTCGDRL